MDKNTGNGLIFRIFDGKDFQGWKEVIILFLMGLNLWNIVQGFEQAKKGEKAEFEARRQKAYAVLSLNLSDSCRDCIRDLEGPDPVLAWGAILKRFESGTPLNVFSCLFCAL